MLGDDPNVRIEIARIVPVRRQTPYVRVTGANAAAFIATLEDRETEGETAIVEPLPDRTSLRIEGIDRNVVVYAVFVAVEGWSIGVRVPDNEALSEFFTACQNQDIGLDLREVYSDEDRRNRGRSM